MIDILICFYTCWACYFIPVTLTFAHTKFIFLYYEERKWSKLNNYYYDVNDELAIGASPNRVVNAFELGGNEPRCTKSWHHAYKQAPYAVYLHTCRERERRERRENYGVQTMAGNWHWRLIELGNFQDTESAERWGGDSNGCGINRS